MPSPCSQQVSAFHRGMHRQPHRLTNSSSNSSVYFFKKTASVLLGNRTKASQIAERCAASTLLSTYHVYIYVTSVSVQTLHWSRVIYDVDVCVLCLSSNCQVPDRSHQSHVNIGRCCVGWMRSVHRARGASSSAGGRSARMQWRCCGASWLRGDAAGRSASLSVLE